jgi:DNA-3-methyladenine glycosylase I
MSEPMRCAWAQSERMQSYHDNEWGTPIHDDRIFFEFLTLEGAQAGLSWDLILKKRAGYRDVFAQFDPQAVANFDAAKIAELTLDARIVRNRAKIVSTVKNAQAFLLVQAQFGSFDAYIWHFVEGRQIVTDRHSTAPLPASSLLSDRVSQDLKKRKFGFVGSTIVYSFLQAVGIIDDHRLPCFRARL